MEDKKRKDREEMIERSVAQVGEDATRYGEFVSTYFAWIPLEEQKENAKKLEEITKDEKHNK